MIGTEKRVRFTMRSTNITSTYEDTIGDRPGIGGEGLENGGQINLTSPQNVHDGTLERFAAGCEGE